MSTNYADIVFPASTFAEKNGTYLNGFGILQRIRPAVATSELDRALDGMNMSRLDKFGTKFDSWASGKKIDIGEKGVQLKIEKNKIVNAG